MDRSYAAFENGISESYHSAIRSARTKPIITMLEEVRVYLMQRLFAMNQKAVNLNDIICHSIRKELENPKQYQRYWLVYPCGQQLFKVRKADEGFGVAAYCMLNQDPGIGVSSWYSKQMWVDAYSHFIKPVGGSSLWVKSANPPPLPPKKKIRKNKEKEEDLEIDQIDEIEQEEKKYKLLGTLNFFPNNKGVSPSAVSNQSFTGLLNSVEQQRMDVEIAALADMNEAEERKARRKDAERVLEEAKKKGVYRKRGASGFKGPYERLKNQMRKKEDPNGPGKQPETTLDVSD
ncbi:hypothetical protein Tco_0956679 [Tanacetum coccineum]